MFCFITFLRPVRHNRTSKKKITNLSTTPVELYRNERAESNRKMLMKCVLLDKCKRKEKPGLTINKKHSKNKTMFTALEEVLDMKMER